jgi:hypothetical protein
MSRIVTIEELEADEKQSAPIWALNSSAESRIRTAGEVHIGIPKTNGTKVDSLYLERTWLPVNLTEQIPREQLLKSSEFRNAIRAKLIKLITPEYAQLLNDQEGAQEERDRIEAHKQEVYDATAARSIQDTSTEVVAMSELLEQDTVVASDGFGKTNNNPFEHGFTIFVETLHDKGDIESLNLIRSRNSAKRSEVKYMLEKLKNKEKTCAFLRQFVS